MFRLEIFVQKKHLADVFERLTGIADVQSVAIVPNLDAKPNGKTYVKAGDTLDLFMQELRKHNTTEFTGSEFRQLVTDLHLNPTSYSHYLQSLVKAGAVKKGKQVGNTKTYHVMGK